MMNFKNFVMYLYIFNTIILNSIKNDLKIIEIDFIIYINYRKCVVLIRNIKKAF